MLKYIIASFFNDSETVIDHEINDGMISPSSSLLSSPKKNRKTCSICNSQVLNLKQHQKSAKCKRKLTASGSPSRSNSLLTRSPSFISYQTDILKGRDNYKIEFSEIGREDINGIIKKAKELNCPIIVRTGKSRRYPNGGKWYLKGKGSDYHKLKTDIEKAQENNESPSINLYLIKL